MNWFLRGLSAGVRTERFPGERDVPRALSPGLPKNTVFANAQEAAAVAAVCPTAALQTEGEVNAVIADRCVNCARCRLREPAQEWRHDVRWAHAREEDAGVALEERFTRSLHVRIVDAGDCGACLNELAQTIGPSYNLHRYGIFITPTPREADVLLVVGPVALQMLDPLRAAYEAMPTPKRVVAVGACAASGGIFGPSVMCGAGANGAVPVDLVVPGCPPSPFAIIDALRTVCGQSAPASTVEGGA